MYCETFHFVTRIIFNHTSKLNFFSHLSSRTSHPLIPHALFVRTLRSATAMDEDEQDVWYFSFGPNMANSFFLGRCIQGDVKQGSRPDQLIQRPTKSMPGYLPGHELAFTMMGYEACEPRFANISALPVHTGARMPVHGIAHRIPRSELMKLDQREGYIADESERAFERVEVSFQAYAAPGSSAAPGGDAPITVFTYVAHRAKLASPAPPSQRYLDLLVLAAKNAGLSKEYTSWLEAQPSFRATAMQVPRPKESEGPPRVISLDELQANRHHPAAGPSDSAWVVLGGQVFDLNAPSVARAPSRREPMLRYMALEHDATTFVLKLFARAYPSEDQDPATRQLSQLSEPQRAYVASWLNFFLLNRTPRVGVLEGSEWQALTTDSSPTSPLSHDACVALSASQMRTPMAVLDLRLGDLKVGSSSSAAKPWQEATVWPVPAWAQSQRLCAASSSSKELTATSSQQGSHSTPSATLGKPPEVS